MGHNAEQNVILDKYWTKAWDVISGGKCVYSSAARYNFDALILGYFTFLLYMYF